MLQLRHVVGVGQEPHIEHQIGLQRQSVFEPEGHDTDIQRLLRVTAAEQAQQLAAQLGGGKRRRVQHKVRPLPHRRQQLPLPPDGLLDGKSLHAQGMAAPRLLVAADDGPRIRL